MRQWWIGLCILVLISGCTGTKETRRSNRAARKLERLVEKFPELSRKDTAEAVVTYIKPRTTLAVSIPLNSPDSMSWRSDDARLIRVVKNDSIFYTVICDTVRITQEVRIPYETIQPTKYLPLPLKWWQLALMWLGGLSLVFLTVKVILSTLARKL